MELRFTPSGKLYRQIGSASLAEIKSEVPEEVQAARIELENGASRERVHQILGAPYLSNETLRIDAFRKVGWDMAVIALIWVPVPSDRHEVYIFVSYDEAWAVADFAIGSDFLTANGLTLAAPGFATRPDVILATPAMSEHALAAPPAPGECILILLSEPTPMERVMVDGEVIMDLGKATGPGRLMDVFSRHVVTAGSHRLKEDRRES